MRAKLVLCLVLALASTGAAPIQFLRDREVR
jgi:hypothetical protein